MPTCFRFEQGEKGAKLPKYLLPWAHFNCLRYAHPAEANLRLEAERLRDRDARRLRGIYGRAQLGEVAPWSDDCIALKNNSSSMGRSTVHLEYRISLESKPGRQKSPIFPW